MSRWLLVLGSWAWLLSAVAVAADPQSQTVDSVLDDWAAAAAQVEILDAKFTRWDYDDAFEPAPSGRPGRIYFEKPDRGSYEFDSQRIVWTGAVAHEIDLDLRTFQTLSEPEIAAIRKQLQVRASAPRPGGWWDRFIADMGALRYAHTVSPHIVVPLLLETDVAAVRDRFEWSLPDVDQLLLVAVPKEGLEKERYARIELLFDRDMKLPFAMRLSSPSGNERTVYRLTDIRRNQRPADRDELLNPKFDGLENRRHDLEPVPNHPPRI